MQSMEVSGKILPQIRTVFQGLRALFMGKAKIHPHFTPMSIGVRGGG